MTIPDIAKAPALIFAPQGRDATVAQSLLCEAGIMSSQADGLEDFARSLGDDVGLAVLTEEAVRSADLRAIATWIDEQPSWSDLPFVVLTQRGGGPERNPAAARLSEVLRNVTFLERPFHATTFVSVARTALKGRRRQYEARARMEDVREGERMLQTALLAGRLGTWELDLQSSALTTSDTCRAIFGRKPEDVFDYAALLSSIHADDVERMKAAMRETIETGADYAIEYRTLWPDGSLHWAEMRARRVSTFSERTQRLVGVSSDITTRKLAEAELIDLNATLEERVNARTRELKDAHETLLEEVAQRESAEAQLRQSQKMEAIGHLTGGVAHDFNNLLMAILGNLDLLRKRLADDPKASRLIDGALQGARRGAALTQRLLAFARRQDLQTEAVNLPALVRGVRELLERSIGPSIKLDIRLPETFAPVMIDGNQVELALLNLAVNARDAMPDGGTLRIGLDLVETADAEDLAAGTYACLSVIDTGFGMDAETLNKAIDPFFSTKELGKGTGLGLSMIHGLALQLKGALRLTSTPGKGTRAELWLPTTDMPARQDLPDASEVTAMTDLKTRITIMIVDDDALIAMSIVDMLEDLGHDVIETNSGAQALEVLQTGKPIDLMITDYSMPGMTGAELSKAALAMRPGMPILIATGYANLPPGEDIDLPRIGKPYTQDQLESEIAKILPH
ncbi:ATP-binding protein [Pararhizobium sp.]|uniref:ATP-binding protein n=1 Tax=Pararhizobium sp. TaxID=1977563 RepID=UPI00271CF44E|nr:ATP-binding protein [Pararhizobium sp.]MDO9417694.1 response regulator [Pararhizobium sp.]